MTPLYIVITSLVGITYAIPLFLFVSSWGMHSVSSMLFASKKKEYICKEDMQHLLREEFIRMTQQMHIQADGRIEIKEEEFELVGQ